MEEESEIITLTARIADALERIADSLERMEPVFVSDGETDDTEVGLVTVSPLPEAELEQFLGPRTLARLRAMASNYSEHGDADTYDDDEWGEDAALTDATASDDTTRLQAFLSSRNIIVKRVPPAQEIDATLDGIANFMGNNYASIRHILPSIKRHMNEGKSFSMSLKKFPQKVVSDITNLCDRLNKIAFFTHYRYVPSPAYALQATPSTAPKALNFYSGQWLERFIKKQVISLLEKKALQFSYLCNPQVVLSNEDDFEFDMLFEAEGDVFWLEAKTGGYQQHIDKYSRIAKVLGLARPHVYLILTDEAVTDALTKDLSDLSNMTVVRIEKFVEALVGNLPQPQRRAA